MYSKAVHGMRPCKRFQPVSSLLVVHRMDLSIIVRTSSVRCQTVQRVDSEEKYSGEAGMSELGTREASVVEPPPDERTPLTSLRCGLRFPSASQKLVPVRDEG